MIWSTREGETLVELLRHAGQLVPPFCIGKEEGQLVRKHTGLVGEGKADLCINVHPVTTLVVGFEEK